MTGPDHYLQAESLVSIAEGVMDYEHGEYASMDTGERIQRRACFLAEAQVHATLALAATMAEAVVPYARYKPWEQVTQ